MSRVVIVGGGIAGLATAYELDRQHVEFVLLEASARAGGVVLSEEIDGYTIDAGPDGLLAQKPEGIALCRELGLGDRLIPTKPPRLAFIERGGRLHPLPASSVLGVPTEIGPFLRTRLFSAAAKMRMGAEIFVPPRKDEADESIGAFITRRFGQEATTYLAEPLLAGIHAGDVNRLSLRSLFPRFAEAERTSGSLLRAFRRQRRAPTAGGGGGDGAFRSLPGGLSEIVRAILARLPAASVRLGTPVARLLDHPAGFAVETAAGEEVVGDAVVLAAPAYATAKIVGEFDATLAALCAGIPYTSIATVLLGFDRQQVRHPLNGSGFVVPRVEGSPILAATWLSSKWPHRAPDDRVLLRAFVGGARDPRALERPDAELVARALDALRPLLGIAGKPNLTRVYRWDRASAQHEVGHLDRLRAIDQALATHPGVFVTGSGFRGVGIPDCVADARATARQVTTWLKDIPLRRTAR